MAERPDDKGIEITAAMIEAGERALYDSCYGNSLAEEVTAREAVGAVLAAALAAKTRPSPQRPT
jgi:hypothetical protein